MTIKEFDDARKNEFNKQYNSIIPVYMLLDDSGLSLLQTLSKNSWRTIILLSWVYGR